MKLEGLKLVFSKRCTSKIWGGSVRSDLKNLDSFTLETSKNPPHPQFSAQRAFVLISTLESILEQIKRLVKSYIVYGHGNTF